MTPKHGYWKKCKIHGCKWKSIFPEPDRPKNCAICGNPNWNRVDVRKYTRKPRNLEIDPSATLGEDEFDGNEERI